MKRIPIYEPVIDTSTRGLLRDQYQKSDLELTDKYLEIFGGFAKSPLTELQARRLTAYLEA